MVTAGIHADTHISNYAETFRAQTGIAFSDCDFIIHAGGFTDQ
jgi:hypothetical protein